jgi:hypothetical protein
MPDLPLHTESRWDETAPTPTVIHSRASGNEDRVFVVFWDDGSVIDTSGSENPWTDDILAVLNRAGLLEPLFSERDKTIAELRARVEELEQQQHCQCAFGAFDG